MPPTELQRTVRRVDELARTVAALERQVRDQAKRCAVVETAVDQMVTADAVAVEVARRLRSERAALFSVPAKIAALAVSLCAVASFVLQLAH